MKKLLALVPLLLCGCAMHRTLDVTTTIDPTTKIQTKDRTSYVGISWFNKTSVTGLEVGKRTGKETTTLSLGKANTETQTEAIKALGEALGAGLAAGVKKTATP